MWLQLGLGGAALLVLYKTLSSLLPDALRPVITSLSDMSRAIERLAVQHGAMTERMARIESKFDSAYDLTPVETPAMQRHRTKTPIEVPTEYSLQLRKPRPP